jgi:hypothetical protein
MNCPLCNKHLLEITIQGSPNEYICQVRIKFDGKATLPHYEEREGKIYWYLPPYQIINTQEQTIVMKMDEEASPTTGFYSKPIFKLVFTMNEHFPPTESEKLLKRIKLLTLFS